MLAPSRQATPGIKIACLLEVERAMCGSGSEQSSRNHRGESGQICYERSSDGRERLLNDLDGLGNQNASIHILEDIP